MKRIIIAGGSGFLGGVLAKHFITAGYDVAILTRSAMRPGENIREVLWDGRTLSGWSAELENATAVINLCGRSVDCRYHQKKRREIMDSRIDSTRVIGEAMARCNNPPPVWLNASTATIYKHTLGQAWEENGEIGGTPEAKDLFSVEVACTWENEFNKAITPRTRKVALRTAMVLGDGKNSVFPVLCRLARLGLGGKMGSGWQFVSWIHQTDFCRGIERLISDASFCGPVNVCAPNPLPNAEMMRVVRDACGVRFGLPASEWMLEFGAFFLRTETELVLKSRRVFPRRLLDTGFEFCFPTFREAAEDLMVNRNL